MSCLSDYRSIRNNNYFEEDSLNNLATGKIKTEIDHLVKRLTILVEGNEDLIETTLSIIADLAFYKAALETKVSPNRIPDNSKPDRVYVQMRGAVPYAKGKRVWVSHYMGKLEEVCDGAGEILHNKFCQGREAVIIKLVERLKDSDG
ncbi:MAG: hypothetical protein FJX88_06205 [Bacteroidetes bacterium]|nr:hypothetical protein [Bacteroidota bacterium]